MSVKDFARETRVGSVFKALFFGVILVVLFGFGAFMLFLGVFGETDSPIEGRAVALLMGAAFWGMTGLMVYGWRRSSRKSKEWPGVVAERIGVPDSVQNPEPPRTTTKNIPNALRGHTPPKGARVVAGRSMRHTRVLLTVLLGVAVGLIYLGWNIETIIPEWRVSTGYLFIALGALLLGLASWPGAWRRRFLGFIAVREGIYAHGQGVDPDGHEWATPDTRWLFVPWANVVDVREGLVFKIAGGPPGGTWWPSTKLSLRLTRDEANAWFPHAEGEPADDGRSRIVSLDYSDSDPSPGETVPALRRLWGR